MTNTNNTQSILQLTKKLITLETIKANPKQIHEALDVIKQEVSQYPLTYFESNNIPSLLIHNTTEETKNFKVILNAHLDVIPASKEEFHPQEKDGKLYGRGSIDMKSSAAAMTLVFKELSNQLNYPLALQIVTDEEFGGENGTKYQLDQGIRASFVLGGDTPGLKINNQAKGVYYIKLIAHGIAAHSAHPWNGKNAAVLMTRAIHKLHQLLPLPEKEAWVSTASVIKIETDNPTVNTISDNCTAYINIRYIPEEKRDLLKELRIMLPEEVAIEVIFAVPPEYTPQNNPFVQQLKQSIEKPTSKPAEFLNSHAQSDLRYYHMINIPAVNFSPIGGNHHAKNEWVDIQSLGDYYDILKHFLLSLS